MIQTLVIDGILPGLNEYTEAQRRNRFVGAKMKKENTDLVTMLCKAQKLQPFTKPVRLTFVWVEKSDRRDPDNFTSFGRKVILDGMVKAGVLPDDSQKWIKGWSDGWNVNKDKPEILVVITEVNDVFRQRKI